MPESLGSALAHVAIDMLPEVIPAFAQWLLQRGQRDSAKQLVLQHPQYVKENEALHALYLEAVQEAHDREVARLAGSS